jgi:hypothetical protein
MRVGDGTEIPASRRVGEGRQSSLLYKSWTMDTFRTRAKIAHRVCMSRATDPPLRLIVTTSLSSIRRFALKKTTISSIIEIESGFVHPRAQLLPMDLGNTSRKGSLRLVAIVFLLALGVFFWGLKYKLSLYDSPQSPSSMSIVQAKILSQKERPPASQADSLSLPSRPELSLIVVSALVVTMICTSTHVVQLIPTWLAANEDARNRAHFRSSFFSFRPPPMPLRQN